MDIIDIILARAKSFTGETATLTRQAQQAMADANEIVDRLEAIESDTQAANDTAVAAAEAATSAAESFEEMKADINAAAADLVDEHIAEAMGDTSSDISDLKRGERERYFNVSSYIQGQHNIVTGAFESNPNFSLGLIQIDSFISLA